MSTTTELECLCDQGVACPIEGHEAALKQTSYWDMDDTQKTLAKELAKRIEVPESGTFWGQPYTRIPQFVSPFFGDGQQLVCIQPLNTRPDLYVIRVDSIVKLSDDSTCEYSDLHIRSLLDEIYDAIEDEYGSSDADEDDETEESKPWPALNLNAGACWFEYGKKTVAELLEASR